MSKKTKRILLAVIGVILVLVIIMAVNYFTGVNSTGHLSLK